MSWLYLSDPDNREPLAEPQSPRRRAPRRDVARLPPRRPVKGFDGRYQFVLPGFEHLVAQTCDPRARRTT